MPDTIQTIIDRMFREWLEPPTRQPIRCHAVLAVTDSDPTIQLGTFSVYEDKQLLRNGILLEVGAELMLVKGIDSVGADQPIVTVERGVYGTTPAAHDADAQVKISPDFTQQSAFEAVRDNIISLHPSLFTIRVAHVAMVAPGIYPCDDPLAISVESAWPFDGNYGTLDITADVIDYHPMTEGRAFRTAGFVGDMWIRYRRRMGVAVSTTDELEDLGVEPVWTLPIMAGAAADLMAGKDLPETIIDWVTKVVDTEAVPVGTRSSLSVGLRRYRDYLIDGYATEMKAEYKPKAVRRSPFRKVGRL